MNTESSLTLERCVVRNTAARTGPTGSSLVVKMARGGLTWRHAARALQDVTCFFRLKAEATELFFGTRFLPPEGGSHRTLF